VEGTVSLFGGRKDEIGPPVEGPLAPTAYPPVPPAVQPAASGTKGFFGRGEEGMANIGKSITIKGDLTGSEDIVVEGNVEGKIDFPQNQLTIGANGTAKAEITAKTIVVIGRVTGNVKGTERVEIQATGVVEGDVSAPRLVVAEGAVLNGSIHMTQAKPEHETKAAYEAARPIPEARKAAGG
jgi:cytoskeletal protein CcmA (bactofilin family)